MFTVNYLALRKLTEALLDRIPDGGAIVNTASIAGGQWPARLAMINELLDLGGDWDASLDWFESHDLGTAPYFFSKECVQVYTMRFVAHHDGARRPHQQRVPVADRHSAARRLPQDDVRQADRLERRAGQRPAGVTGREVGLVLAFLGSDAASHVNGVNLLVDAGFTAAMTTGQVDFAGSP